jgi:transposase
MKTIREKINGKYILLDNARIHHSKIVKEYTNKEGINMLYNVPYMPEYNPIEKVFSKIKPIIAKKKNNEKKGKIEINIIESLKQIKEKDLKNFYDKSLSF